ncbi:DNA glycosylase AlkZ-like family protein [Trueperella sp. LYQ141]|uniref:DNA glycosylase AlkZ-like family protein n=1 Tax=Trueperella sp. LYQ141 TaxID=3391058 RepID=UPI003983B57A
MVAHKVILPLDVSYARMTAQLLLPSVHKDSVVDIVGHMLAMQGQSVYAFPHAAIIRSRESSITDVVEAFERGDLVRHRPIRGTVHITRAQDYHWLRQALNHKQGSFTSRQEEFFGITEQTYQEAFNIACELIACGGGSVRRRELFAAWIECFSKAHAGQDAGEGNGRSLPQRFAQLLMWGLDRQGLLVEGPMRKNEHYFIDARRLPAADSAASGFYMDATVPREQGLAEVAYRYARGHGPVSISDLARWASLKKSTARNALEENIHCGRLGRYTIVDNKLAPLSAVAGSDVTFYCEPDLMDRAADYRHEAERIFYLPSFDELHVGYHNRTCLTDEMGERVICPAGNGMFRSLIVDSGRVIAVFPSSGVEWIKAPTVTRQRQVQKVIDGITQRMELLG